MAKEDSIKLDSNYFSFVWFDSSNCTLLSRFKLAVALLLTPFTLPLLGRSIGVRCETRDKK